MHIKTGPQREEYGQMWEWREPDINMRGHWKSIISLATGSHNLVMIFPPSGDVTSWYVDVCDEEWHELCGEDAEGRAFAIGSGFTRQVRGPRPLATSDN